MGRKAVSPRVMRLFNNMRKRILSWFKKDCPYYEGVAIYRQTGGPYPSQMFEQYLTGHFVPDDVEKRLKYALECYLNANQDEAAPQEEEDSEAPDQETHTTKTEEPKAISNLRESAKPLHKRQAMLHSELRVADSDKKRLEIASEIMENIIPDLDGIYDRIREWQNTGELPSETSTIDAVQDTVKKMLHVASLKSRISRLTGFMKKQLSAADRQKYEEEKLEKEIELAELEAILGLS